MSTPTERSPRSSSLSSWLRWALLGGATAATLALVSSAASPPAAPEPAAVSAGAPTAHLDPIRDPALRLGADFAPLSAREAESLGLAAGTALAVVDVRGDSLAARAGLLKHDVITAIAGPVGPGTAGTPTASATWEALCAALEERSSGGALDFFVRRDGRTRIVHVTLAPLDESAREHDVATGRELPQTACV